MAKSPTRNSKPKSGTRAQTPQVPRTDQFAPEGDVLTTIQGLVISDNHNSLKAGARGPSQLEDFVLREKITSFDHERIPERVVHARGSGAFGQFVCSKDMSKFTEAGFLSEVGKSTPVLARFSTVAGSRGSTETARDVRGFAVKFYTDEGNYDLVGNNIPVFFIQDAMKFPDLIHAVKPEQHNEIPQASSAHDTFWDFISLMPESLHMIFWLMSDRAIPRSYRMMEGFGVHSFRFVNKKGEGTFVKFHWKPRLGIHALVWEEAQLISGMDPDFHRRDLFEAIDSGAFPEWDLGVQLIPQADEHKYDFDLLDPTKLVPEELVPVTIVGTMTLNRTPDNFFSEIEQAVFHPGHLVPGIDVTNDPLLQGRLFSYTDTQITRLGGPNFHELPVNRPLAAVNNHQRDGFGRQTIPKGRVAYEPNSLAQGCPFHAGAGVKKFVHYAERLGEHLTERVDAHKVRARSQSFGDHFSQAQMFFRSQTNIEQEHIRKAFTFDLSKVETAAIRERMLETLMMVDIELAKNVAAGLNMLAPKKGVVQATPTDPQNSPVPENRSSKIAREEEISKPAGGKKSPDVSDPLSMVKSSPPSTEPRKVAVLATDKTAAAEISAARKALAKAGVTVEVVAPGLGKLGDRSLKSTPSVVYDGVIVMTERADYADAEDAGNALKFVAQAFKHLKTIGGNAKGKTLLSAATMGLSDETDLGLAFAQAKLFTPTWLRTYTTELSQHRHWQRAELVKGLPA